MTRAAPRVRLGRTRRVCGVALVFVGVALAASSVWSFGRDATVGAEGHGYEWSVSVTSGVVQVQLVSGYWEAINVYPSGPPSRGPWKWNTWLHQVQPQYRWWGWSWFRSVQPTGSNTFAAAPLWTLSLAALGAGALLIATSRVRTRSGRCHACGYDLAGLRNGVVCPECGPGGTAMDQPGEST